MKPAIRFGGDRGSGSLLGLAVAGSTIAMVTLLVPLIIGLGIHESVDGAADAAALAAADVAAGIAPGVPCEVASRLAVANGASVTACEVDGLVATVRADRDFLGLDVVATATAGPPGAVTN